MSTDASSVVTQEASTLPVMATMAKTASASSAVLTYCWNGMAGLLLTSRRVQTTDQGKWIMATYEQIRADVQEKHGVYVQDF
jgi:uncharacterized protein YraI